MKGIHDPVKQKLIKNMTSKTAGQFLVLGLFWLLFSIPLVTMGPATCAVFYVGIKILNGEVEISLWKSFIKGFKLNFKQGILMSLISVITLGGAGFFDYWIVARSSQGIILILLAAGVSLSVMIFNLFVYPLIARYENTFSNSIKNAIALAFTYSKDTLRLTGLAVLEYAVVIWLGYLNLFAGLLSLLFWPSVIFYTVTFFMCVIFYHVENPIKYDDENDAESEVADETETEAATEAENETEAAAETGSESEIDNETENETEENK
jgi:uncharacterized membrane protein YesL